MDEFIRNAEGQITYDDKGQPKTQEVEKTINTFTLVNVFDVSGIALVSVKKNG